MKLINLTENYVIIEDGNITQKIKIDEEDANYLQIKKDTNNFTDNLIVADEGETLLLAIADLDAQREQDKIEQQLALTELAGTILGGNF